MDIHQLPPLKRNSSESLYLQVYRIILQVILQNKPQNEDKLPGMKLLAEKFGVSTITINQALNRLIQEGYCFRSPKKGTFVYPGGRKNIMEDNTIVLFNSNESAEYDLVTTPFYTNLRKACEKYGRINLLIISGKQAVQQLASQMKYRQDICGVILTGVPDFPFVLQLVQDYPLCNFVLLNYQFPDFEHLAPPNLRGVFNDEFCGGYMAASQLISRGYRRIGVLMYSVQDENYNLRLQGFRQAHRDLGVSLDEMLICSTDSMNCSAEERGSRGMALLLERQTRPDALFCLNDILAAGARRYLKLNAKDDGIEIIGHDNHIPELHIVNHFSTIEINSAAMATAAVQMLLKPADYPCKQLFISPRFIRC